MRLGNYLSSLTLSKLEYTKSQLNLADDESRAFDLLSRRKSIKEIASKLNVSTRTVDRMIRRIADKIDM